MCKIKTALSFGNKFRMSKLFFLFILIFSFMMAQQIPQIPENFTANFSVIRYEKNKPPVTYEYVLHQDLIGKRIHRKTKNYFGEESLFAFCTDKEVVCYIP